MRRHIVTAVLGAALLAIGLTLTSARPAGAVLTLTISGTVPDSTTVAEGILGTIDVIVTELAGGGDNAMAYEGSAAPAPTPAVP